MPESKIRDLLFVPQETPARRVTSGEFGDVYIFDEASLVVKMPKKAEAADHATMREALIVADLQNRESAPLALPELLECAVIAPFYNLFTKVDGVTLHPANIEKFSEDERKALGQKIGAFTAWMAAAMPRSTLDDIWNDTRDFVAPDRSSLLHERMYQVIRTPQGSDTLGHLICELYDMHQELRRQGRLEPTLVGHFDLRPANITFKQQKGVWLSQGVIDFGITQPSTPELELRHAAILGKDIVDAAVVEYEDKTGQAVDYSLLGFWAIVQVALPCAYIDMFDDPTRHSQRFKTLDYVIKTYADVANLDLRAF